MNDPLCFTAGEGDIGLDIGGLGGASKLVLCLTGGAMNEALCFIGGIALEVGLTGGGTVFFINEPLCFTAGDIGRAGGSLGGIEGPLSLGGMDGPFSLG